MKAQYKIMGLVIASVISTSVFAVEPVAPKPVTRIDFNKMIDQNNGDKSDLQKSVDVGMDKSADNSAVNVQEDKNKVLDFIDVEVGMGPQRPIVDRRFNSTDAPRIATEFSREFSLQMFKKTLKGGS